MNETVSLEQRLAAAELRIAELARQKSRHELLNTMMIRLTAVTGLETMAHHIISIVMETIGAANIHICFQLQDRWKSLDLFGAETVYSEPQDRRVVEVLTTGVPTRFEDQALSSVNGSIPTETWIFPLLCKNRTVGVVVMEQMQLTHETIMQDLKPFFLYAAMLLDNEINNFSVLADAYLRLKESEMLYRTLFEQIPDGVVLWELPGLNAVQFNSAAHQLLGYSREEFEKLSVADIEGVLDPVAIENIVVKLSQNNQSVFESKQRTKNGELKDILVSLQRFQYGGEDVVLAIHHNITDRKRAEEEKKNMEQQVLQTQKLESLGVLAGGIAHDFNNILMAILGNAELAKIRLRPESPAVDNLDKIEKSAARAADLAKQMLAYSGKGKFVVEQINFNYLMEEMLHLLEVSISKKAILRLNLHDNLPGVKADATQMRQIVMNLVINASEAIGDKSGVIAITTGCMDCDRSYLKDVWLDENLKDGLYVYLEIADTGCGMDKETLARLFDPFFTTKFTGRGLGMSAVLGIVRGHHGAIKVYSEENRGTTFKILLPASDKPAELFNGHNLNGGFHGSGTILLVDDEESVRGIGAEMLKEIGYSVITATDGRDALEKFRENPDIAGVILDLTMPKMDGEQCFRELRILKPDIKVIMASGYSEQEVSEKFIGKGVVAFIQKPYKLSMLQDVMKKLHPEDGAFAVTDIKPEK